MKPDTLSQQLIELRKRHSRTFLLTDTNVQPLIERILSPVALENCVRLVIAPGEQNKTLQTAQNLWTALAAHHADRSALLVNIGGGVVTDMGGFVASTYKRGISYVNIPTTILAAVDAAIGGKTAIDLDSLKNSVGTFAMPKAVLTDARFFDTLSAADIFSGFGEIIKTQYIRPFMPMTDLFDIIAHLPALPAPATMHHLVDSCAQIKSQIVSEDPLDTGLRRILNFGHTTAHALETLALRHSGSHPAHSSTSAQNPSHPNAIQPLPAGEPIPHGIAVQDPHDSAYHPLSYAAGPLPAGEPIPHGIAVQDPHDSASHPLSYAAGPLPAGEPIPHGIAVVMGIGVALVLSAMLLDMPKEVMYAYRDRVLRRYPRLPFTCKNNQMLIDIMRNDKKNTSEGINFVLLQDIGNPLITSVKENDILEALDLYSEIMQ